MKKILYGVLALSLSTAGFSFAAHNSASQSTATPTDLNVAVSDTVPVIEEEMDEESEGYDEEEDDLDNEEYDVEDDEDDEEDDEFGEMHDDYDQDIETSSNADDDTPGRTVVNATESSTFEATLPEGMKVDAAQQMQDWNNQNYLTDDSTKVDGANPDVDADVYIRRLQRIPATMEMPYNDVVRKYIDQYTGRLRRSVSIMLGSQNFYVPMFEEALEAEGCPLELKYLPVIESAFNPQATSRVGAAGLWQFMVGTGKQYGLEVNSLVDQRRDPVLSSQAAARYFKDLYAQFGDWTLVIAAYNCGPTNVNKAIQRAGGSKDYWEIYPYLPNETRGYVPAFIAANYVMQYYCEHGIEPLESTLPAESDTIVVSRDLHLQQVADLCDVDLAQLKSLNPQYRQDIVPGYWQPCILRLPQESVSKFIEAGDSIYNHRASELLPRRSTAAVNTTATTSVRSSSTSSKPSSKSSKSKNSKKGSKSKSSKKGKGSKSSTVTVRQGDTLGAIARRNGTTVAKLRQLNGISGSNIRAGKKIRVK